MQKLYAVILGGRAEGCNMELHDVVFVTGTNLKETYPKLIDKWFGHTKRLHIDSYIKLETVDGFNVTLKNSKPENKNKLFFVNFGAYQKNFFGEVHQNNFYVAATKTEALAKAKKDLCAGLIAVHCDDNLAIDEVIKIDNIDGYYLHLEPNTTTSKLKINSSYRRLDLL